MKLAPQRRLLLKTILAMKLTCFFFLLSILAFGKTTEAQKVTVIARNSSIINCFNQIEQQTRFSFFYKTNLIATAVPVTIDLKNVPLETALERCFSKQPFTYSIEGRTIVIKPRPGEEHAVVLPEAALSIAREISGTVKDPQGNPLEGVTITVHGTDNIVMTNAAGVFVLKDVPEAATLDVEMVGYFSKTVQPDASGRISVTLVPNIREIDEVVVIGYGTRTKGALTGSVSKVDSKTFEQRPLTNTLNGLQGAMPGVTVVRGSGQPGAEGYSLQIRGYSSINGNQPLTLIDGVPGDMNTLNPNDIDNITVLKDAAASIYGARAADGVVIITTKRGKSSQSGAPFLSYSTNVGVKIPHFLKKMAITLQLAEMLSEGYVNVGRAPLSEEVMDKIRQGAEPDPDGGWNMYLENYPGFYQSFDWNKIMYGKPIQQNHNLNVSGGNTFSRYMFSVGYNNNNGIMNYGKNKSDRYNMRLNYDFKVLNKINIETRTSFDNQQTLEPSQINLVFNLIPRVWSYAPLYNTVGSFYTYQGYINPALALTDGGKRKAALSKFSTNIKADIELVKNLKLVGQTGVNLQYSDDNANYRTFPTLKWDGTVENVRYNPNSAYYANNRNLYKLFTAYLDYSGRIGDHSIAVMAGASHEENDAQGETTWGYNFRSNDIFTLNLADRTKVEYSNFTGSLTDWALTSYFSRISYGFQQLFFADFTTRIDGSSKFSPDKRWSAIFPAASAGFDVSRLKFMDKQKVFDLLKLRASWGLSGNQELSFGNYDYIPLVNISGAYPFGSPNAGYPGAVSSIASPERTWEKIESKNIGLNMAFFKNRLGVDVDYFIKTNNNMLVNAEVPTVLGGVAPTQNLGVLETKGWELALSWKDKVGNLSYAVSGFVSDAKNKLKELKANDVFGEGLNRTRKGYALNSYFGYQFEGFIQTEEQLNAYKQLTGVPANLGLGDVMFADVDGDGAITAFGDQSKGSTGDLVYLGNLLPRYTYSANIDLNYKGIGLSLFFQGVGQRKGMRDGDFNKPMNWVWFQPLQYFYGKTWTPKNTDAQYPRIIPGSLGMDGVRDWDWRPSAMRMDNLAYLRLKVITVSYDFPASLYSKLKMQSARIYASGQDLFTFAKGTWKKSYDPEETWGRSDEQTYPFSKVISVGLDIRF